MNANCRKLVAAYGLAMGLLACHAAPDTVAVSYADAGTGGVGTAGSDGSSAIDGASVCIGRLGTDAGADAGLAQGLVAYYACDQATGTTLPGLANNNNATLVTGTGGTGGYSFATGKVGKALALTAANEGYATLPAGLLAHACEATIAAWVNIKTQVNYQRVWDFGWDTTVYMYLATGDAINLPRFGISIAGNGSHEFGVDGQAALPVDEWHHLAVVLGPSDVVLYVDGQPSGTSATIPLRPADLGSTPNNFIGRSQFSVDAYLDGAVDELRIYDRALSPREIQTLAAGA